MPLSEHPLGRPCPVHLQGPGRHDDGPVRSFGGLPAGDALRNGCVRPGLKTAWHPTRRPGRNQACVRRANFFFVRIKKPDLPLRTMKLALGPVQSNAKGGRYVSLEDSEEIFYRRTAPWRFSGSPVISKTMAQSVWASASQRTQISATGCSPWKTPSWIT